MNRTSLSQFLGMYRAGEANVFHKRLGGQVSEEGLLALDKTLKIVKFFIPDEDIPSYVEFVLNWGKSRGFRVDHEALRSQKLISAFTKRRYRYWNTARRMEAMRQTTALKSHDYEKELDTFVYEAKSVFDTQRDWTWAFIVALDRREWHYRSRLEGVVKQFLAGDKAAMGILASRGLNATVQTQH